MDVSIRGVDVLWLVELNPAEAGLILRPGALHYLETSVETLKLGLTFKSRSKRERSSC